MWNGTATLEDIWTVSYKAKYNIVSKLFIKYIYVTLSYEVSLLVFTYLI